MISTQQYNEAVDKYADGLYRFALKMTGDRDDAQDLVQDAFEKLWKNRKKVNSDKVKSYLFTIVYHKFVDNYRKKSFQASLEETGLDPAYTDNYSDVMEILQRAVDQLPPVQKSVILLRDWEGYSYKEIENITGLNESQVKVYIFRARKFLREYIKDPKILI